MKRFKQILKRLDFEEILKIAQFEKNFDTLFISIKFRLDEVNSEAVSWSRLLTYVMMPEMGWLTAGVAPVICVTRANIDILIQLSSSRCRQNFEIFSWNFGKLFWKRHFFIIFFWKKWKIFLKNRGFSSQILIFLWKSSIFPIFEAPSAPRKYPSGGFGAPKKALLVI